jgi:hypothetical protein
MKISWLSKRASEVGCVPGKSLLAGNRRIKSTGSKPPAEAFVPESKPVRSDPIPVYYREMKELETISR